MKVTIDGQSIEVEPGTTILQAARMIGGEVVPPAMCYYSKLKGSGGKCRCCLVEVAKGSEADPRPMPKLMASCVTGCMDGMEVNSKSSERVQEARKSVTEFLLINHPLDCPVCDQAGECDLQNLSFEHGKSESRFIEEKNIKDIIDATSAKERFNKLDSDRNSVLTRARSCSALTIPSVLPADGHTETAELATPYQALGARLVNNLSSKLLLSLLPPNTSFFRLIVSDDVKETLAQSPGQNNPDVGGALSEVEGKLVQIEQQILKQIEREALRVPTFEAIKSLIITGNALCYKTEANLDTYKLNDYVIVRDFSGTPIEIITRATAVKDSLPQTIIDALGEDIPEDGKVNIYTRAVYKNGVWYEYQTVEETLVEEVK